MLFERGRKKLAGQGVSGGRQEVAPVASRLKPAGQDRQGPSSVDFAVFGGHGTQRVAWEFAVMPGGQGRQRAEEPSLNWERGQREHCAAGNVRAPVPGGQTEQELFTGAVFGRGQRVQPVSLGDEHGAQTGFGSRMSSTKPSKSTTRQKPVLKKALGNGQLSGRWPGGQERHVVEPRREVVSGGHGRQIEGEVAPRDVEKVFAGHGRHRSRPWAPGKGLKYPGWQGRHDLPKLS